MSGEGRAARVRARLALLVDLNHARIAGDPDWTRVKEWEQDNEDAQVRYCRARTWDHFAARLLQQARPSVKF